MRREKSSHSFEKNMGISTSPPPRGGPESCTRQRGRAACRKTSLDPAFGERRGRMTEIYSAL